MFKTYIIPMFSNHYSMLPNIPPIHWNYWHYRLIGGKGHCLYSFRSPRKIPRLNWHLPRVAIHIEFLNTHPINGKKKTCMSNSLRTCCITLRHTMSSYGSPLTSSEFSFLFCKRVHLKSPFQLLWSCGIFTSKFHFV